MKLIIAYIKPERLNPVKQELYKRNIFKMSVSNALGCGQQKGYVEAYRGAISEVNLLKKVRLAIAVNDEFVQPTVDGIIAGARTGHIGRRQDFRAADGSVHPHPHRGNRQRSDRVRQFNDFFRRIFHHEQFENNIDPLPRRRRDGGSAARGNRRRADSGAGGDLHDQQRLGADRRPCWSF